MSIIQKQNFVGLDLDTDLSYMEEGSYRYALNVHVGSSESGNTGTVENVKGNTLISFSLPSGTNKVIGSYEDRPNNRVIYFLYNSNGTHGIYAFNSNTTIITNLFEWSGLNFQADKLITGVGLVSNLLSFVDGYNPPRCIDLNNVGSYSTPYTDEMISLIKRPPNYAPSAQRIPDVAYPNNYILKKEYQFATRFIYMDSSKSKLSPYSKLDTDSLTRVIKSFPVSRGTVEYQTYTIDNYKNCIELNLNISEILSSTIVGMIKKIEVYVREGNTGVWGVFKTLTNSEFTTNQIVKFYNDSNINIVDQIEISESFDSVPLISGSLSLVKNRIYLGNNTEGFDLSGVPAISVTQNHASVYDPLNVGTNPSLHTTFSLHYIDRNLIGKRVFKDRGVYNLGIAYYDKYNRMCGVQQDDTYKVSIRVNSQNTFENCCTGLGIGIGGTPPDWAHYYSIVRTKNLNQDFFQQIYVTDVNYLMGYDASGNATYLLGTGVSGGPNYGAKFNLGNKIPIETHIGYNSGTYDNISYTYSEGDRLFIYYKDENGADFTADLPIKGLFYGSTIITVPQERNPNIRIDRSSVTLAPQQPNTKQEQIGIIKLIVETYDFRIQQICSAEIYNPTKQDGLFYEVGETYPVTNPETPTRAFSTTSLVLQGDVYLTLRGLKKSDIPNFGSYIDYSVVESLGMLKDNYYIPGSDIGRVNTIIADERQVTKETGIRFSNLLVQGSNINGISTFFGLNEKILAAEYGSLNKLQIASNTESDGNVLLSIHTKEIVSLYIEQAVFSDLAGKTTIGLTNDVIGEARPLRGSLGSVNPESVVQQNGCVYGWDGNKGVVWRYAADGLTKISDLKMKASFYDIGRTLLLYPSSRAFGAYDPYFDEYILTFIPGSVSPVKTTIAFSERLNRWTSFYSFVGENYQKINTKWVSFNNGGLYLHGTNSAYGNFYGTQYTSKINPICNLEPSKEKVLLNVSTESKDTWVATEITTPEGQKSILIASDYVHLANAWSANVLRDIYTPNIGAPQIPILHGDVMRSSVFSVLMECSATNLTTMKFVNFKVIPSERSNK